MMQGLRELARYREVLYAITARDIRVRYKQSVMGFLWAILMPTLIVLSGVVVRQAYALASGNPLRADDVISVAVKAPPWAFLVSSVRFACTSLTSNRDLVTKVYFPKVILPISAVLASLFDCCVAFAALLIVCLAMRTGITVQLLWVPVLMLGLVLLVSGVAIVVSAASLFFRDVKYIVDIVLTFGVFFTPVFYEARMLGEKGKWLALNPVTPILEGLSRCIAQHSPPDLLWLSYAFVVGVVLSVGGYACFKYLEPAFAESI